MQCKPREPRERRKKSKKEPKALSSWEPKKTESEAKEKRKRSEKEASEKRKKSEEEQTRSRRARARAGDYTATCTMSRSRSMSMVSEPKTAKASRISSSMLRAAIWPFMRPVNSSRLREEGGSESGCGGEGMQEQSVVARTPVYQVQDLQVHQYKGGNVWK